MPHFISPGQLRRVKHAVDALCGGAGPLLRRLSRRRGAARGARSSPIEDSLIRIDPGFPRPMRICRLDAFLQGYDVKFLEFNADSPAGIGYTDILYEGLSTTIDLPRVRQEFDMAYTPILPELIGTLLDAYAHVRATPRRPARRARGSRSSTSTARRASPSSASSAPPPRRPGSRPCTPRSTSVTYDGTHAAAQGRAGPPRLPPRAAGGPRPVRPRRRRARRARLPRQPVPLPGGQQQEAVRALPGPALRHLIEADERGGHRSAPRSRGRGSCAPAASTTATGRSTCCPSSPTTARSWCSSPPRTSAATASRSAWRPRRTSGTRSSPRTPSARTSSCRSTSPCPRRCSRRSRTGTSRCASSASTSTPSASEAVMPARSPVSRTEPSST